MARVRAYNICANKRVSACKHIVVPTLNRTTVVADAVAGFRVVRRLREEPNVRFALVAATGTCSATAPVARRFRILWVCTAVRRGNTVRFSRQHITARVVGAQSSCVGEVESMRV